jgi:hypothetical protein
LTALTGNLASYTQLLFIATAILAIIAAIQAFLFLRGLKDTGIAARAAADQAIIAQKTFETLERPYLFVFGLSGIRSMQETAFVAQVKYRVANYGKVAGVIEGLWVLASTTRDGVPEEPLFASMDDPLLQMPILAPQERRVNYYLFSEGMQFDGAQHGQGLIPRIEPREDLFFKIIVAYRGPFTRGHVTTAAWRWDQNTGTFVILTDPAQNIMR